MHIYSYCRKKRSTSTPASNIYSIFFPWTFAHLRSTCNRITLRERRLRWMVKKQRKLLLAFQLPTRKWATTMIMAWHTVHTPARVTWATLFIKWQNKSYSIHSRHKKREVFHKATIFFKTSILLVCNLNFFSRTSWSSMSGDRTNQHHCHPTTKTIHDMTWENKLLSSFSLSWGKMGKTSEEDEERRAVKMDIVFLLWTNFNHHHHRHHCFFFTLNSRKQKIDFSCYFCRKEKVV